MVPDASIAFAAVTLMAPTSKGDRRCAHGHGRPPGRFGALAQKLRLELSKGGADVEDQPPGRAGGVDVLLHRPQTDAACRQGVHGGTEAGAWIAPDRSSRATTSTSPSRANPRRRQAAGVARCMWSGWPLAAEMNSKVTLARRTAPS